MTRLIEHQPSPQFLASNDPENWQGWLDQAASAQKAIDNGYLEVAEKRLRELDTDARRELAGMPEQRIVLNEVERLEDAIDDIEKVVPFRGALHGYRKGALR